ncbi:hypothetical protein MH1LPH_04930 [Lactiplantibacillus brownii]
MLERGGHVCEPRDGLTSRAFSKLENSPAKRNFTTEHHPARPTLISKLNINRFFDTKVINALIKKHYSTSEWTGIFAVSSKPLVK